VSEGDGSPARQQTKTYGGHDMDSNQTPAERTRPGVAGQIVNVFNPHTGEFVRQLRHRGTVEQARAAAEIGFWHPTQERWHELRAIILGH
jgi:hypothetical protein